jgi:hypothetical protein
MPKSFRSPEQFRGALLDGDAIARHLASIDAYAGVTRQHQEPPP